MPTRSANSPALIFRRAIITSMFTTMGISARPFSNRIVVFIFQPNRLGKDILHHAQNQAKNAAAALTMKNGI